MKKKRKKTGNILILCLAAALAFTGLNGVYGSEPAERNYRSGNQIVSGNTENRPEAVPSLPADREDPLQGESPAQPDSTQADSTQTAPTPEDSARDEAPSQEDPSRDESPSQEDPAWDESPPQEDPSRDEYPAQDNPSWDESPSQEDSSWDEGPSQEDPSWDEGPSQEDPSQGENLPTAEDVPYEDVSGEPESGFPVPSGEEESDSSSPFPEKEDPERGSGSGDDDDKPAKPPVRQSPSAKAAATYYCWVRLDLNGGTISSQTRYPQFYVGSNGHTIGCRTLANVDRGSEYLAFIGSGADAGKSFSYWDAQYYNSSRLYLPRVGGTTSSDLNPSLNAAKAGCHVSASKAYNTRPDGSGTSFTSRDYNASYYATLERITGSSTLNLTSNSYKTLYVNWLPNTYTILASVKKDAVPVTDAGASFLISEWSEASSSYKAWSSSLSMTDNGDGTCSLPVTYTDDNLGKFRIRMTGLTGDYSFSDTAVRYIEAAAFSDGAVISVSRSGTALDWEISDISYQVTFNANGGTVYGSSSTTVKARAADSGSTNLRFGRTYTVFNTKPVTASGMTAVSPPLFTRDGYIFGGWANAPDPASATLFLPNVPASQGVRPKVSANYNSFDASFFGITPSSSSSARKITLYAQWVPRIHQGSDPSASSGRLVYNDSFAESGYSGLSYYIPYQMDTGNVTVTVQINSDFTWHDGHFYYNNELSAETEVPGSLSLTLTDRAFDLYGRFYDVVITLSDIRLNPESTGSMRTLAAGSQYIFTCTNSSGKGSCSASSSLCASYNIDVSLIGKDGSPASSGSTLLYFSDLDQPDKRSSDLWKYFESGSVAEYAEAITVPEYSSTLFYTYAGENSIFAEIIPGGTRICGSEGTGQEGLNCGTITNISVGGMPVDYNGTTLPSAGSRMSSAAYISDVNDLNFIWSGSSCVTALFKAPLDDIVPVTGTVTVNKRDEGDHGKAVSGAVLCAMRYNGSTWEAFGDPETTDENGQASFTFLCSPANDLLNRYYIYEPQGGAPAGYRDTNEKLYYKIDQSGTVTGYTSDAFSEVSSENTLYDPPDEIDLTVVKTLDRSDLMEEHGDPNFAFEISGTTVSGESRIFHMLLDFTGVSGGTGTVFQSKTITIPSGTYTIRELDSDRFSLTEITTRSPELHATITSRGRSAGGITPVTGFASGTLTQDAQVTFANRKTRWEHYSHTSSVINSFS